VKCISVSNYISLTAQSITALSDTYVCLVRASVAII